MFDHILIPVDGSACARRAAKYGLELARRYDAETEIVHVARGDADAEGEDALEAIGGMAAELGVPAETTLLRGSPAEAIAKRATDAGADLVAMGRQGRAGVKAHLLGSVTERVLRRSDVPVLTVPHGGLEADTGASYENVLLTTDGSETAELAGPYGTDVARQFGAALHVLSVADARAEAGIFDAGGVDEEFLERLEAESREAVESLVAAIDASDLDVREAVVRGAAHEAIDEYVSENGVDLVAMSSEGQSNLAGQQLGTVTGRVLRTVGVPVLVVIE